MTRLIETAKKVSGTDKMLPFSLYTSIEEQYLINVPIIKPLLICVLGGTKNLGLEEPVSCAPGQFIFLSNSPRVEMRNVPKDKLYCALLIEFEFEDFSDLPLVEKGPKCPFVLGEVDSLLESTLLQFIEWSDFAPSHLWPARRREILQTLVHLGYSRIKQIAEFPSVTHQVHDLFRTHMSEEISQREICDKLAMSESTLRRKLQAEGTQLQDIKDSTRLGYGLHLVQTTHDPIGLIAEQCGYQSQSRFTDRFKALFGTTPSELRKTRMTDFAQ